MTSKQTTLIKQALERWQLVPPAEREKLIEELKARQPGTAVIELDKPEPIRENGVLTGRFSVKAQIVSVIFGMDIARGSDRRYLFLSDIPISEEV